MQLFMLPALLAALLAPVAQTQNASSVQPASVWGNCIGYSVHAATAVSFNGVVTKVPTGNVGVAPGTSISGSPTMGTGSINDNNAAAVLCAQDKTGIYDFLMGQVCPASNILPSPDMAGKTFLPGVWCSSSLLISASTVTLDAAGNPNATWVFQTKTSLSTATATSFILQNGAQASNVFWVVGSSASIGYSSSFVGGIVAYASVTIDHDAVVIGRALAGAAVSFAGGDSIGIAPSNPHSAFDHGVGSGNGLQYKYLNQPHCACVGIKPSCATPAVLSAAVATITNATLKCATSCNTKKNCVKAFYQLHASRWGCSYKSNTAANRAYQTYSSSCSPCFVDAYKALTGAGIAAPTCDDNGTFGSMISCSASDNSAPFQLAYAKNFTNWAAQVLTTSICFNGNNNTLPVNKNCSIPACNKIVQQFIGTRYACNKNLPAVLLDGTFNKVVDFCGSDVTNRQHTQCTVRDRVEYATIDSPYPLCSTPASQAAMKFLVVKKK